MPNAMHMIDIYPIFVNKVAPFFVGKDARQLEPMLWELYRHGDNYKYQGLALWVCLAAAEFAVLDLLGKLTGRSIGNMLGGVHGARSPFTGPAASGATRPKQRSPISRGWSPRPERKPSSSASAAG